jgi:hypothetical protein
MAVSVLGDGALYFDAQLNTSDFDAGLKTIENNLQSTIDKIVASAGSSTEAIQQLLQAFVPNAAPAIQETIDKLKELQGEEQKFTDQLSKTTDPAQITALKTAIEDIHTKLEEGSSKLQEQVSSAISDNLKETINELDTSTDHQVTTMTRLRQIKNELASGTISKDDPQFQALLNEATGLEHSLRNVNKELQLASSNTAAFDALGQGVRGLIGGFEALSGILAVTSGNNEVVEKTTRNVVAAMGVLNGIEEIGKVLAKDSALNTYLLATYRKLTAVATVEQAVATEGLAVAEGAQAVATEGAAVAQTELNIAMDANPAGVLLLALGAIIAAYEIFSSNSKDAADEQKKMNEAIAEANGILTSLVESYSKFYTDNTKAAQTAVDLAQAQGKSESEILGLKQKANKELILEQTFKLSFLGMDKQTIALKQAELDNIEEQIGGYLRLIAAGVKLTEEDQNRLDGLKEQKKAVESILNPAKDAQKALDDANKQKQLGDAEAAKKAHDDALKSDVAAAEARLVLARHNADAELVAQKDAIREKAKAELDNVNLTAGERKKILAQEQADLEEADRKFLILSINNKRAEVKAKLDVVKEGSTKELLLRLEDIDLQAKAEIAAAKGNQQLIDKANADANKSKADLVKKNIVDTTTSQVNTEISAIKQRLSVVKVGSEEELKLKKNLVDQQAELDANSAFSSIKNVQQYHAKLLEIEANSVRQKRDLDDAYVEHLLQNRLKIIEQQTKENNIPLEAKLQDPFATEVQKDNAQAQILENSRLETIRKIKEIEDAIKNTQGDTTKLTEQDKDLKLQLLTILAQIYNIQLKTNKDTNDKLISDLDKLQGAFGNLATAAGGFNQELGDSLKLIASMIGGFKDVKKGLDDFKTAKSQGDTLGQVSAGLGIAGAAIGVISSIASSIKAAKQSRIDTAKQIADFNQGILFGELQVTEEYRNRQREQVKLNKLKLQGLAEEKKLLEQQKKDVDAQVTSLMAQLSNESFIAGEHTARGSKGSSIFGALFGQHTEQDLQSLAGKTFDQLQALFDKGQLTDKAKSLFEELQKLKQEGADIDKMLTDNKQQLAEIFTGTTADDLLNTIVDGFKSGLRSAADFADSFQGFMQQAMLNALKFQYLEAPLKTFFDDFAQATQSGNQLTSTEIAGLKDEYNSIITNASQQFQQLQQIAGVNFNSVSGSGNALAGAIKGMTEDTAELIAGQFGGLRLTAIDQLNIMRTALDVHRRIEANTALAVSRIEQTNDLLTKVTNGTLKFNVK